MKGSEFGVYGLDIYPPEGCLRWFFRFALRIARLSKPPSCTAALLQASAAKTAAVSTRREVAASMWANLRSATVRCVALACATFACQRLLSSHGASHSHSGHGNARDGARGCAGGHPSGRATRQKRWLLARCWCSRGGIGVRAEETRPDWQARC